MYCFDSYSANLLFLKFGMKILLPTVIKLRLLTFITSLWTLQHRGSCAIEPQMCGHLVDEHCTNGDIYAHIYQLISCLHCEMRNYI